MKPRRPSKSARRMTWFKCGVLAALLLGAGSLYTPYPVQLIRVLLANHGGGKSRSETPEPPGKEEARKESAGAPQSGLPSAGRESLPEGTGQPSPPAQSEDQGKAQKEAQGEAQEKEPQQDAGAKPWKLNARFSLPVIELPPFPPALPLRVDPASYDHIAEMAKGINVASNVNFIKGNTATEDRNKRDAYRVKVSLELLLPRPAATGDELALANPKLPKLLNHYDALMKTARVSPWFHALYKHKQNRVRKNAATLDRLIDRHNFFDTDTILEIKSPDSGRRVLWVQADMDVVSDGSDGDRLPTMPEKIRKSDNYQPSTSYFWRKRTDTPNPLLPTWEDKLKRLREQKASSAAIEQTKRVIDNLKRFSYLLAEYDPFIVIPLTFREGGSNLYRPQPGDYAAVVVDNRVFPAIVGDFGPNFKTGEASLRLAKEVNPKATVYARAVSNLGVSYIIFPGSREAEKVPLDYQRLHSRCRELLDEIGGLSPEAQFVTIDDKLAKPKPESNDKKQEKKTEGNTKPGR